jgi:hypothetical protein
MEIAPGIYGWVRKRAGTFMRFCWTMAQASR